MQACLNLGVPKASAMDPLLLGSLDAAECFLLLILPAPSWLKMVNDSDPNFLPDRTKLMVMT